MSQEIPSTLQQYETILENYRNTAIQSGRPVSSIEMIRELHEKAGLGLKEAKDIVDDFLKHHSPAPTMPANSEQIEVRLTAEIENPTFEPGHPPSRLGLMRLVRKEYGLSLSDARRVVTDFCDRKHPNLPVGSGTETVWTFLSRFFGQS